ncbi:MAG: hypothetical protein IPL15_24870 [Comamonadaceae bacterium]|uniref:hypothetical protein n=1 Tax=Candidatus Skiveiella danica TaxID=3386177 RepID=UPI00390932EC|nr:hypothetical protein [Comamonadaceae bacterium]
MSTLEKRLEVLEAPHDQTGRRVYTDTERAAKLLWILAVKGPHYELLIEKFPQFARTEPNRVGGLLKIEESPCTGVQARRRQQTRLGFSEQLENGLPASATGGVNLFRKTRAVPGPFDIINRMAFKLSLIALVYPNAASDSGLNIDLLQRANAWLQRRNSGSRDDLLLIGTGFEDEPAFRAMLKSYGLANAEIAVIPPDEFDESDGTALGESVELIAARWISKHHSNAIPVVKWSELISDAAYPADGWWWAGLEAADDEQSSLAAILGELLPDAFNKQALTWATIIAECDGLNCDVEEHEAHEAAMQTVALARWLTGFDAATENNFLRLFRL